MIRFFTQQVQFNLKDKLLLKKWIKSIVLSKGAKVADINIILCSDSYLLEINKQYLSHDYYTDIITFDYCDENTISGDLFISIDTVRANSQFYKTEFSQELHRVIIHGVLHLLGLDDKNDEQTRLIREAEDKALALLALMRDEDK